jgi:hypothetical protein
LGSGWFGWRNDRDSQSLIVSQNVKYGFREKDARETKNGDSRNDRQALTESCHHHRGYTTRNPTGKHENGEINGDKRESNNQDGVQET